MQAMILAAGFGTRLLPHTRIKPKPLFPILNEPLLLLTIKRLQRHGFDRIVVNCHHLQEQIVDLLSGIEGVIVQREEMILGTGGGLRRAMVHMRDEPLLVTNGDIYHTIDYSKLYASHLNNRCQATLGMHDYPRFNSVQVTGDRVNRFQRDGADAELLAFTGLYVLEPQILATIVEEKSSCIVDHFRSLLVQGENLAVYRTDESFWTDMGTVEDYLALHEGVLKGTIPRWQECAYDGDDAFLVDEEATLSGSIQLHDWCSLGKITAHDIHVARSVVWDGVRLPEHYSCENVLISETPEEKLQSPVL